MTLAGRVRYCRFMYIVMLLLLLLYNSVGEGTNLWRILQNAKDASCTRRRRQRDESRLEKCYRRCFERRRRRMGGKRDFFKRPGSGVEGYTTVTEQLNKNKINLT